MLGKASEIKMLYLEGLQHCGVSDCGLPDNAIIIDIKFSTSYEQNYGVHSSALIIYREYKEPVFTNPFEEESA